MVEAFRIGLDVVVSVLAGVMSGTEVKRRAISAIDLKSLVW
jgi:hypothetical protein